MMEQNNGFMIFQCCCIDANEDQCYSPITSDKMRKNIYKSFDYIHHFIIPINDETNQPERVIPQQEVN